ncbi:MAG TPA: hypothetical protein VFU81_15600 [Thermomicrobiales bacterium]|nr:hypothetical protein [Thermomicrobiales bacterium]
MLFRSEEGIVVWSRRRGRTSGEALPLATVWALAQAWYGDRLRPDFRGRSQADAEAIFRRVGLTSAFWAFDR